MPFFRKKPVTIEAVCWDGENFVGAVPLWIVKALLTDPSVPGAMWATNNKLEIYTLEGTHEALAGDWIIKGIKGELYPCKPDIFEATYDPALEAAP